MGDGRPRAPPIAAHGHARHAAQVRALPGDTVALCPPLVISLPEIDEMFDKLEAALDDVARAVGR